MSQFALKMDIVDNARFSPKPDPRFNREAAISARRFHQGLTGYRPTPLNTMTQFAHELGVAQVLVKDESQRFDLNAFKILGGTWAIARLLCRKLDLNIENFSFRQFREAGHPKMTFTTTTDGNHGRGVAWAARALGQNAVIYMPKGSSPWRVKHITDLGAECIVTDMNYDDTVRLTMRTAAEHGWEVVQDTAWEGYTDVPTWIMQGYATLADEAAEQMEAMRLKPPTHILLQAGVGAMAGGVLGYFADRYGAENFNAIIVEPDRADCLYRSAIKGDMVNIGGELNTIMAGLACGEPNPLGWPLLRDNARQFISCEDSVAALGMRVLGNPPAQDPRTISGESGAVCFGVLAAILHHPQRDALKKQLNLTPESRILTISTEGDTDPQHYREVVWEGKNGITHC
ncbi:diaminopropionate ammonia-lyase [Enterobacteriaceae bacterium YMB-R22]|jgi:diaminopropionate ammonia-lyase|uniref:diaminopropionate ammonia-lyase n=1 Tax=Tenebrionicola larvae TaxID=2815733 RepID=UPI0020113661|nr:diaminopropionate ammonia-lyase [Tenebrionicola larvae]MBV4414064.1 diaminopropionate ammonia-lyase [Tenebrionicola larvae]